MTICERMFNIIEQSKPSLSAAGLAKVLNIGTGQTTTWKKRNTDPPAKYLAQICEYLGVSIEYLVTGEDSTEKFLNESREKNNHYSSDEERLIKKYRLLDEDGKDAVRGVLLAEQRRVESEKGEAKTVG